MDEDIQLQRVVPRGASMPVVGARDAIPLRGAERFLLVAIRVWRRDWEGWENGRRHTLYAALAAHFTAAGFGSAWPEFAEAMETLLFYGRRELEIRPTAADAPSTDEKRVLTLCILSQAGCEGLVAASLAVLMPPCCRPVAGSRLSLAAAALRTAGLVLPPPAFRLRPRLH